MVFFILPIGTWTYYNIGPLPENSGTGAHAEFSRISAIILIFEGDSMANHPSALKRYRQNQRRRLVNQMNRHKLKTQIKRLRAAIAAGKGADAKPLLPATFSIIDQSVQKGVIKKNTARRYKSRLAKRVNPLPA